MKSDKKYMYKLVIFDLDDCLIDTFRASFPASIRVAIQSMVESGLEIEDFNIAVARLNEINNKSRNSVEAITKYLSEIGKCSDSYIETGKRAIHYFDFDGKIKVLPGVFEMLKDLESIGIDMSIVTRGNEDRQMKKIKFAGIDSSKFKKILTVDDYDKTQSYSKILDESGHPPERILVVGDRYKTDLIPASNLGMKTAWIPWGRGKIFVPAKGEVDYVLNELKDIVDIVKN